MSAQEPQAVRPTPRPRRGLAGVLVAGALACTFVPPPPLPDEAAGAQAAEQERVRRLRSGEGTNPPAGAEDAAAPAEADPQAETTSDPQGGDFTLEEALAGLPGQGALWVRFDTDRGPIDCELLPKDAPRTVANFVGLARGLRPFLDATSRQWVKRPYYDGTVFHRVIPGFMIQGGDQEGTGEGGAGYTIPDEISPNLRHDRAGVLSMANRGPGTGSAQFFITLGPTPHLDGKHTIFGRCDEHGVQVADDISMTPRGPNDRPKEPEHVKAVKILRKPAGQEPAPP